MTEYFDPKKGEKPRAELEEEIAAERQNIDKLQSTLGSLKDKLADEENGRKEKENELQNLREKLKYSTQLFHSRYSVY